MTERAGAQRSEVLADRLALEARRAVAFGHAHVVLIHEGAATPDMPERVARSLREVMPAFRVAPGDARGGLLQQVEEIVRNAPTGRGDELAGGGGPRLAVVVPDALEIPEALLRELHGRTEASSVAVKLVLLVDREASALPDPAALLTTRLGVGVAKVEDDSRAPAPHDVAPAAGLPTFAPAPPRIEPRRRRRTRPIAVRRGRRGRGGRALALIGLLAAALALGWAAAPAVVRHASASFRFRADPATSAPREVRTDLEAPAVSPRTLVMPAGPRRIDVALPVPQLPPVGLPAPPKAPPAPTPAPPHEPLAAPGPAPTIAVNFNAVPWAELEVDGRALGPTPVGRVPLTRGAHRVRARFPDGRVVEREIEVDALRNRFHFD